MKLTTEQIQALEGADLDLAVCKIEHPNAQFEKRWVWTDPETGQPDTVSSNTDEGCFDCRMAWCYATHHMDGYSIWMPVPKYTLDDLVEKYDISVQVPIDTGLYTEKWFATIYSGKSVFGAPFYLNVPIYHTAQAKTPRQAAMRALVASKQS